MSTQLSTADRKVDLRPRPIMPKPMLPNYSMAHAARTLKGADVQIKQESNAGLRTKQNQFVRMFIDEQKAALYRDARQGTISEKVHQTRFNALNRIRDKMIETLSEWAGNLDPKQGVLGTGMSREFESACHTVFNQLRNNFNVDIKVNNIPIGPIGGHKSEKEEERIIAPPNLKLSDLEAVEPSFTGPLYEHSVQFNEDGTVIRPILDLPVFIETEENSGIHSIRPDEVSPSEDGDDTVRDIE